MDLKQTGQNSILSPPELERWSQVLQRQAAARLPIPQTAPAAGQGDGAENGSFVV